MKRWAIVVVVAALAFIIVKVDRARPPRPRYIFINETDHHEHDTALKMSLKLAEQRAGIENALVLLKQLPERSTIEQTADALFRHWQIGRERSGKGLLFVYAEKENRFRVEVSYALEGLFPDVLCREIEEAAKTYMLSEVPQDFLSELLITMNIHGQRQGALRPFKKPDWSSSIFLSGGGGAGAQGYVATVGDYMAAIRRAPSNALAAYGPSPEPREVVERYLASLAAGLGDPRLPLLTAGAQIFRVLVPRNDAQQLRVSEYYRAAMPFQLTTGGDLGLAVFRPGFSNLPIVLRRATDGLWFVDEPKAWTYFHRFESESDFHTKYGDSIFLPKLREWKLPQATEPLYGDRLPTPRPPAYPYSLTERIQELEGRIRAEPANARHQAALAELYLFEMNWLTKAIPLFERAAALAPEKPQYHWRLWDLYVNNSEIEKGLVHLKWLAEAQPRDAGAARWYSFYSREYIFAPGDF